MRVDYTFIRRRNGNRDRHKEDKSWLSFFLLLLAITTSLLLSSSL
jgi:hypothetical protein